jgi:hypothetical protein
MKGRIAVLIFALACLFAIPARAQNTVAITVPPFDAGLASYMHPQLYSVPVTIGSVSGTMWLYPQTCNSSGNCGFITFRSPLQGPDPVVASVTAWFANTYNTIGQVTSATLNYTLYGDPNSDGDRDTVMGSITFTFSYHFVVCGRYCTGWHETLSGSGAQSITQD